MIAVIKKTASELKIKMPDLITRPVGKRMYKKVHDRLRIIQTGEVVILDFEGIKVIDSSFIDEFILRLIHDAQTRTPAFHLKLKNISGITELNIDSVFNSYYIYNNRRIAVITDSITSNNTYYIGKLTQCERDVIDYLRVNKSPRVSDIADYIRRSLDSTVTILDELHAMRLIRKESRGGKDEYTAV